MSLSLRFQAFIDYFIPAEVRARPEQAFRARLLVLGCLNGIPLLLLSSVFFCDRAGMEPMIWATLLSELAIIAALLTLRYTARIDWAARIVGWPWALLTWLSAYLGMGLDSILLLLTPASIVFYACFVGLAASIRYTVIVLLTTIALVLAQLAQKAPYDAFLHQSKDILSRGIVLMMVSLFILGVAYAAEWGRRQFTRQLQDSEERFFFATEASNDGIFDWDIREQRTSLSGTFCSLLGYQTGELKLPHPFAEQIIPPHERLRVEALRSTLCPNAPDFDAELLLRRADGTERWFQMRGRMIYKDGVATRMVGSMRDISERKELEELKDELISNVSHELRTPLTSILGSLSLLQHLPADQSQRQRLFDITKNNAHRLLHFVNDLLDLQRIEQGKEQLDKELHSLKPLLEESLALHQGFAEQKDVTLQLTLPAKTPIMAFIDAHKLHQILSNLLSNAIKHSPRGEIVKIKAWEEDKAPHIAIIDKGPGIPKDLQKNLFERFSRAPDANEHKGTGLGLSIARELVKLHQGELTFSTSAQTGTTFTIKLPPHNKKTQPTQERSSEPHSAVT